MSRKSVLHRVSPLACILFLAAPAATAEDWPGWLGPFQNGKTSEEVFGQGKPELHVAWERQLGKAYSQISVVDGKAITMYGDGETDWLLAVDAGSGEELWRYRIDEMFPKVGGAHGGQLSSPRIDGGVVYGLGAKGQLYAVKLKDGSEIWSQRIDEKYGARQPYFGFTTSPLVVGDMLIVQAGGSDGHSVIALNKKNGKKLWSHGDEKVGYQSPIAVGLAGEKVIVVATNTSVSGLHPDDGKVLWSAQHGLVERDGWATPVLTGKDTFVLAERNEAASFRVKLDGDGFAVEEAWRSGNLKGNFATPVFHDGYLYGYNGDYLSCVNGKNGEQEWKTKNDASGLIVVDGHLVLYASDGNVVVAEATPEAYVEIARLSISEEGGFTYPSFSDGGVFVRNMESMIRIDVGM